MLISFLKFNIPYILQMPIFCIVILYIFFPFFLCRYFFLFVRLSALSACARCSAEFCLIVVVLSAQLNKEFKKEKKEKG